MGILPRTGRIGHHDFFHLWDLTGNKAMQLTVKQYLALTAPVGSESSDSSSDTSSGHTSSSESSCDAPALGADAPAALGESRRFKSLLGWQVVVKKQRRLLNMGQGRMVMNSCFKELGLMNVIEHGLLKLVLKLKYPAGAAKL